MTTTPLAFGMFSIWEVLISLMILAVPIVIAVVFFRLLLRNKRENIRLRLEVGKLADELEKVRKQEGAEGGDSQREP